MSAVIAFAGMKVELYAPGFLWLPDASLLCASDLHFEKGSFFHRFASPLPPYDTAETLLLLDGALKRFNPRTFVALGDSFHDMHAFKRMRGADRDRLLGFIAQTEQWIWIEGNHDLHTLGAIPGRHEKEYMLGAAVFRHQLEPSSQGWEISGHYHPKAIVNLRGHVIRSSCFLHCANKLILPALGSFTGGLDVNSEPLISLCPPHGRKLYLVRNDSVYAW